MDNSEQVLREVRTIMRQLLKVLDTALADEQTRNEERMKRHLEAQGITVTEEERTYDAFEI